MISVDMQEVKDLENQLKTFAARAYPFATRKTINDAAWRAREWAQQIIGEKMVERNKWTRGSVRVAPERSQLIVERQKAVVGSTEAYLRLQEFGGIVGAKTRGAAKAIPTSYSAGQEGARPRTRLPSRLNKMSNIKLARKYNRAGSNRKQRWVMSVRAAVESGTKHVFLDMTGGRAGIFRVLGGRRGSSRGWPRGAKIKMVQDLSRHFVEVPANPWLGPACDRVTPEVIREFYRQALQYQIDRHHIFVSK